MLGSLLLNVRAGPKSRNGELSQLLSTNASCPQPLADALPQPRKRAGRSGGNKRALKPRSLFVHNAGWRLVENERVSSMNFTRLVDVATDDDPNYGALKDVELMSIDG